MSTPQMREEIDRLYRQHVAGIVARLLRRFGSDRLELIEASVQDAFLAALHSWPERGVPAVPAAWLMTSARNAVLDRLRRERFEVPDEPAEVATEEAPDPKLQSELRDDTLAMMFVVCHPALPLESQVALALRTLAGFETKAIARAMLAEEAAIEKRLVRARRELRERRIPIELPAAAELGVRLDAVLATLYLLFSEGYASHHGPRAVRAELCREALRLGEALAEHPLTDLPNVHALLALMWFHACRLEARSDESGRLLSLAEQDRTRWDRAAISRGFAHLARASSGEEASAYHFEAGIAACHVVAPSLRETDWERILGFYDRLVAIDPSPVIRLNRVIAVAHARDAAAALEGLRSLASDPKIAGSWLYEATLADLTARAGDLQHAKVAYERAIARALTDDERAFLARRLAELA